MAEGIDYKFVTTFVMKYFTRQFIKKNLGIISIVGILLGGVALLWVLKNSALLFNSRATGGTSLSVVAPSSINKTAGQTFQLTVALNPNGKKITEVDLKIVADAGLTIQSLNNTSATLNRVLAPGVIATDGQSATLSIATQDSAYLETNENIAVVTVMIGSGLTGTKTVSVDSVGAKVFAVGFPDSVLDGTTAASISFSTRVAQTPFGTPVVGGEELLTAAKTKCENSGGKVVAVGINETNSVPTGYQCVDRISGTSCEIIAFYQGTCVFPTAGVTRDTTPTPTISPAPTDTITIRQTPVGTPVIGGEEELTAAKAMCENNGGKVVAQGINEMNSIPTGYQCVDKVSDTSCELIAYYHGTCLFPTSSVTRIPSTTPTPTVTGEIIVESLPPTVTTGNASSIASTSFAIAGRVTSDNGSPISECGFLYSRTSTTPTIGTASKRTTPCGRDGSFSSSVSGLSPSTQYYVRGYSINNGYTKTGYGNVVTVKTASAGVTAPPTTTVYVTATASPTVSGSVIIPTETQRYPIYTTTPKTSTTPNITTPTVTMTSKNGRKTGLSDTTFGLVIVSIVVLLGIGGSVLLFVVRKR